MKRRALKEFTLTQFDIHEAIKLFLSTVYFDEIPDKVDVMFVDWEKDGEESDPAFVVTYEVKSE